MGRTATVADWPEAAVGQRPLCESSVRLAARSRHGTRQSLRFPVTVPVKELLDRSESLHALLQTITLTDL